MTITNGIIERLGRVSTASSSKDAYRMVVGVVVVGSEIFVAVRATFLLQHLEAIVLKSGSKMSVKRILVSVEPTVIPNPINRRQLEMVLFLS